MQGVTVCPTVLCKESLCVLLCYAFLNVTVRSQNTLATPSQSNHTCIFAFLITVQQKSTQLLPSVRISPHIKYGLCPDCLCWPRYWLDDRAGLLFSAAVKSVLIYESSKLLLGGYRGYKCWGTRLETHRHMGLSWPGLKLNSNSTIQLHAIVSIAGLHPQSPRNFAWQPSSRVSQNLPPSYLSHTIAAATYISRPILAPPSPWLLKIH
jgi:hypothetical protein